MAKIRKRGSTYQIDYYDPTGKRIRQTFKKRKDAEAELGKRVSLIAENRYLDVKKDYRTTLSDLLTKYQENYQDQRSFSRSKSRWLENFREYFGAETLLANIRYVDVETYQNHLKRKLVHRRKLRSDAAINREMSCLRHLLTKAVEWEMMEQNPFRKGKSLLIKENNKRLRFLSEEEIERLLAECPKHLHRIVECAIHTGMRRGEILSLEWDQIRNGQIYLTETKTKEPRQIPVNDDLAELFKEIRREQGLSGEYVFTYASGEHHLKSKEPLKKRKGLRPVPEAIGDVKVSFTSACRRAGIEDFRFHDLRHTFSSHFVMRGGSLKELQELLGHKTITMTMRYAHLSEDHKRKAVSLLNGLTLGHKMVTKPIFSPVATLPKS